MSHKEVDKVLKIVEKQTGYPVSVTPRTDISTHSAMKTASKVMPVHAIFVNPKHESVGNYLVVIQCAMILIKWAHPKYIYGLSPREEAISEAVRKTANQVVDLGIPKDQAMDFAKRVVTGLLQQVNSVPVQMLAAEWCFGECPSLRQEQHLSIVGEIREQSGCLAPPIKLMTPKDIFERNASMNAAFALWWASLFGEKQATLPYKAMGFTAKGELLLGAFNDLKTSEEPRYCKLVDAWASILGISDWYKWVTRAKQE